MQLKSRKAAITQKMIHLLALLLIGIILFIVIFSMTGSGMEFIKTHLSSYTDCFKCFSAHSFVTCVPLCWML